MAEIKIKWKFKEILVIGGTGTLGKEIINQVSKYNPDVKITVLSRDEQKQQALKKVFPKVKFVLGDIKDKASISKSFRNKDIVFHVAALKHIDHIEDNPIESIKTNILGTINVSECATESHVQYCVFSSTDKAVDPLNTYGHCKAISERILLNENFSGNTRFSVYRWGNICGSNGSAIPFFVDCLKDGREIPITDERMSRFWINIETAVSYVLSTFHTDEALSKVLIPPIMKSAKLTDVVKCLAEILDVKNYKTKIVGLRKGEKLHESLTSLHSSNHVDSNNCEKYTKPELKALLRIALKMPERAKLRVVKSSEIQTERLTNELA